jgi:RHS repeat-associated protein
MKGGILFAGLWLWLVAASSAAAETATLTHDANGNLTSRTEAGVQWVYAYDTRDQLREVRRDGMLFEVYWYDAQGRRVRKTSADGVVRYVWDGNQIVVETDDAGNTIARYHYAGDRLVSVDHVTEGTGFYLLDVLGTPVGLVRADGTVAARYRLDAWGVLRTEEGDYPNPFRFTGHQFDEGTGLYYAKARYYDASAGRFLSEDPVNGAPARPASLHKYSYAFGNPTTYFDPDGRDAIAITDMGGGQQIMDVLSGQEEYALLVANDIPVALADRIVAQGTGRADISADRVPALSRGVVASVEAQAKFVAKTYFTLAVGAATGGAATVGASALGASVAVSGTVGGATSGLATQAASDVIEGEVSGLGHYAIAVGGGAALGRLAAGLNVPDEIATRSFPDSAQATIVVESAARPGASLVAADLPPSFSTSPAHIQSPQPGRTLIIPRVKAANLPDYQAAAAEGRLIRTDPKAVRGSGFRRRVEAERGPPPGSEYQADHIVELCVGGQDCAKTNSQWLTSSRNRSAGGKIGAQVKRDPLGTRYIKVQLEEDPQR